MTAKDQIINLYGLLSPQDIAEKIGVSIYYVNRVIKAYKTNLVPPLTLQNYAIAYRQGIKRKCDLAQYFGVSRMTVNRFENKPEIKKCFDRYIRFREDKVYMYNLRQELSGILEMLEMFEPKSRTTKIVKALLDQFKKYDKTDN